MVRKRRTTGSCTKSSKFWVRLIEHSFVSQLQGKAKLAFEAFGVVCTLDIPLASLKP